MDWHAVITLLAGAVIGIIVYILINDKIDRTLGRIDAWWRRRRHWW